MLLFSISNDLVELSSCLKAKVKEILADSFKGHVIPFLLIPILKVIV